MILLRISPNRCQLFININKLTENGVNPLNVNVPILVHRQFMTEMQMSQFWYIPF